MLYIKHIFLYVELDFLQCQNMHDGILPIKVHIYKLQSPFQVHDQCNYNVTSLLTFILFYTVFLHLLYVFKLNCTLCAAYMQMKPNCFIMQKEKERQTNYNSNSQLYRKVHQRNVSANASLLVYTKAHIIISSHLTLYNQYISRNLLKIQTLYKKILEIVAAIFLRSLFF